MSEKNEDITLSKEELIGLLKTSYERGWYGSKDLAEVVSKDLLEKYLNSKKTTYSGFNQELIEQLMREAEEYKRRR